MGIKLPKIDLNPFDDPGGPLEIDLGDIDLLDWEIDLNPFDAGELLEVDLVDSVENIATAIEEDPIGTLGTIAMTMAGMPPWAISLVQGANTVAQGGSIEDAVKGMVLTYAGAQLGDIAGNQANKALQQLTNQAGGNLVNPAVANAIGAGSKNAAISLVHGKSPQEIANSFLMGNVSAGVGSVLGKIDDSLGLDGTAFEDLSSGVQDAITAGVTAAIEGGDVTAEAITGLVKGYGQAVIPVAEKLQTSMGLNERQATLITDALGRSMQSAFEGGDPTDAFFESFRVNAEKEMKDWVNSPEGLNINRKLDDLFNNTPELEEKAETMNEAGGAYVKASEDYEAAIDNYNRAVTGNNFIANEEKRLLDEYNRLKGIYNDTNDETTYNAAITAQNNLNTYIAENKDQAAQYQADIATYKPIYDAAKTAYESTQTTYTEAKSEYDKATNFVLSDIDDLGDGFKPIISAADMAVATAIRPTFDPEEYKRVLQLGADENAATHYLSNQADGDAAIAASIAGQYQDVILKLRGDEIDELPGTLPGLDTRVDKYGRPTMPAMPSFGERPELDTGVDGLKEGDEITAQIARELGFGDNIIGETLQLYDLVDLDKKGFFVNQLDLAEAKTKDFVTGSPEKVEFVGARSDLSSEEKAHHAYSGYLPDEGIDLTNWFADTAIGRALKSGATSGFVEEVEAGISGGVRAAQTALDELAASVEYTQIMKEKGATDQEIANYAMTGKLPEGMTLIDEDQFTARMRSFTTENSFLEDANDFVSNGLLTLADNMDAQTLTVEEREALKEAAMTGKLPEDFEVTGTLEAWVRNLTGEAAGEIPDVIALALTKNPWVLGAVGIVGAGEAISGAEAQASALVDELANSGELQNNAKYQQVLSEYGGDVEKTKAFLSQEILRHNIAKIGATGSTDALIRGTAGNLLRPIAEGAQGTFEGAFVRDAANFVLGMDMDTLADATGAFVSEALAGKIADSVASTTTNIIDPFNSYQPKTLEEKAYTGLLNSLSSWGAVPDNPRDSNATELVSTLSGLGFDTDTIAGIGNVAYNNDFVTKTEISNTLKTINPAFNPTEELSAQAYEQFGGNKSQKELDKSLETFIDPYYFDRDEVKAAAAAAGVTLTDEQIDDYEGQKDEEAAAEEAAEAFDSMYLDIGEVKAAAEAEGITLTDEQAEAYVGQKDEAAAVAEISAEYDSQGTSRAEAEQFFGDLGYTPTEAEITSYMGATPDTDQKEAIASYVDPRQVTGAEARKFFEDQGYEPTDEEVANYVGQGTENFETNKKDATALYVDPRQVTDAEARKFFSDLGYTPTDEEVADFVAQVAESEQQTAISDYVDPRFVTQAEVQAIADQEGLTLTEALAATYLGQKDQESTLAAATAEFDPLATTTAEAKQFFETQGFTPTDQQVADFVASKTEEEQKAAIAEFVDPRQVTTDEAKALFNALGYEATDEEVADFVGQGEEDFATTTETGVGTYVDPRQVTDTEARQFFANLGYEPTDEQVEQFVAQVEETTQSGLIASYVDPRQVTREEVQAIADEEGLTLTDALAATYVGQGVAENYASEKLSEARAEYDPLATTLEEATQFFADTGYSATPEELAQFVASKTEETQTSAIGGYVDPRQVTAAEAEEFLSAIGYQPSQEDIAAFAGQVNDENYQTTQKAAIDEFVDPRFFDAGEVRAAYEELGLVDVTQEDVDRFVGQYDPESEDYDPAGFEAFQREQLGAYAPTATFNIIKSIIGSPAIVDDPNTEADESKEATGIYAEFEKGATKDEALQAAIDKLSTDLGLTEDAMLEQLGLTKEELSGEIDAVAEDIAEVKEDVAEVTEDVAGLTTEIGDVETRLTELIEKNDGDVDTALEELSTALGTTETNILAELGTTKDELTESFTTAISDVEASLGNELDTIAKYVGKPARDVTQTDIDFVIDLIAQENVSQELITQYDVTGDGIVDINDQTLLETALQGEEDVTLADTSMFTPATGLYQQQQQDTQTTQDLITQLNTQLNTKIDAQTEQQNVNNLMQLLGQAEDIGGQRVTVTTPDPVGNITPYDFKSIFRDSAQASRYVSPFGGNQANVAQQALNPMSGFGSFAQGGQVEDENDMLLKMLGELK